MYPPYTVWISLAQAGSFVRILDRAAPKSTPTPSDDRRCSSRRSGISAIRIRCSTFSRADQPERPKFADQPVSVCSGVRLFLNAQGVCEELDNLTLRARRIKKQLQNRNCCGIEKVGVPGNRVEDNGLVDEVPDQKAVDGGYAHSDRRDWSPPASGRCGTTVATCS